MNNAFFGKTVANARKKGDIRLSISYNKGDIILERFLQNIY